MNALSLALASIRSRKLTSFLCIVATAAGIVLLSATFILSQSVSEAFARNARGIDMVVGTKGSPLQLILSSIYHADVPAGNIDIADYEQLQKNPRIRQTIPLALGDNYRGWRVVGSNTDYPALFHAELEQGQMFAHDFEVIAGAQTDVPLGAEFAARHGYAADSDDVHDFYLYKVVGCLKPTGTAIDRLLITTLASVQQLHAHPDADDPDAAEELALGHQLTAVLIKTRSATDLMNLPHQINDSTNMMAAVPSYEVARLAKNLGLGRNLLLVLGAGFLALSSLMLLGFLAANLASRRYDLAVLRVLGASRGKVWLTVIFEGLLLSAAGCLFGLLMGRAFLWALATQGGFASGFIMPQQLLVFQPSDLWFLGTGLAVGLLGAFLPALSAARANISLLLAQGPT